MLVEKPTFIGEQVGKLGNLFKNMRQCSLDGIDKPIIAYRTPHEGVVIVDAVFVNGMTKAAESIKKDLKGAGQEHLFYAAYRKDRQD